jgi:hypothetical protein
MELAAELIQAICTSTCTVQPHSQMKLAAKSAAAGDFAFGLSGKAKRR